MFGEFDNRAEPLSKLCGIPAIKQRSITTRIRASLRGKRPSLYKTEGAHLKFNLGKKKYVYAYIRKNGCTAFKKFICDLAAIPYAGEPHLGSITIQKQVIFKHELYKTDRILVLRKPHERLISLFCNKFIQRSGANDIIDNYKLIGKECMESMTFQTFLHNYVFPNLFKNDGIKLDPHCQPQSLHLWPIKYNKVFMLADLYQISNKLFDTEIGNKYFKKKENSTQSHTTEQFDSETPVRIMRQHYLIDGQLPTPDSLINSEILAEIKKIYMCDYKLIEMSFDNHQNHI
jgi:hypothetical protein